MGSPETDDVAALESIESAAVPDITDTSYQAQFASLGEYAQTAFNEVLAQYRFLGLLAGIQGPNDTDQDVTDAREAVMEALAEFLQAGPLALQADERWKVVQAERDALQERIFEEYRSGNADWETWNNAEQLMNNMIPGHFANQSETWLEQMGSGGAYYEGYSGRLASVPDEVRPQMQSLLNQASGLASTHDMLRAERRAAVVDFFSRIWQGVRDYYNENMELIRNGQWLLATGRIAIDAAVFAAEEIVVAGIVTAIIGITGGVAAGMALALRSAVRTMLSIVRQGTRVVRNVRATYVFRIELRKVEPGVLYSNPIPINVTVSRKLSYERVVDVEKDLTPDERRATGEGGQGSLEPDADASEAGTAGDTGVGTRWQAKEVAGRKVYQRDDIIDPQRKDRFGRTNVQRMKKGLAPIGPDGLEINLHHVTQDEPGPMAELVNTQHKENFGLLHIYRNQHDKRWRGPDGILRQYKSAPPSMDRTPFDAWKKIYWRTRAVDFGGNTQ